MQPQEIATQSRDVRCNRGDGSRQRDDVDGRLVDLANEQGRAAYTAMAVLALGKSRFQIGPACDRLRQSLPTASDCLGSRPPHVLECLDLMSFSIQAQPSHEGVLDRPSFSRVAISEPPQNPIAYDTDAFILAALYPALVS
jgi:hypothetical protein